MLSLLQYRLISTDGRTAMQSRFMIGGKSSDIEEQSSLSLFVSVNGEIKPAKQEIARGELQFLKKL